MKVLRREETWIHTHFVTDCQYLPADEARRIRRSMKRLLDKLGIVFGIHFESAAEDGLRIVLECIPLPDALETIESKLAEVVAPIAPRPRETRVQIEPPRRRAAARRR